jgi:transcriptional regulator with XRE-family HTH domain
VPSDYIGVRVTRWRDLAGLTQQQLADKVGVSREYISMIENGKRAVTKRDLLLKLARALRVDVNDLTGAPYPPTDGAELALHTVAPRLRRALDGEDGPMETRPLERLRADADTAMAARMACDYGVLGDLLPELLAEAIDLAESRDKKLKRAGMKLFVKACVTGSLAVKHHGFVDLGIRLADRATDTALELGEPVHLAAARFAQSQALLAGGSLRKSLALAVRAADDIAPHVDSDAGKEWYGMLHLQCGLVSATVGDRDEAATHLCEAEEVARHVRGSQWQTPWRTEFGPANVGAWRVAAALESGEPQMAPVYARHVDRNQLHTVNRRVRILIDTARGHFLAGQQEQAVRCLLAADDISPVEMRSRPEVREIVGQLARDAARRKGSSELRTLVARLRLDPVPGDA